MRRYLIGLALVGQFVLPTLASGQANNQQVTYLGHVDKLLNQSRAAMM